MTKQLEINWPETEGYNLSWSQGLDRSKFRFSLFVSPWSIFLGLKECPFSDAFELLI